LPTLEDESVDLILTDPPWSIGKKSYDVGEEGLKTLDLAKINLFRVLKISGSLLLDSSFKRLFDINDILKSNFIYKQPIILYCNNQIGHRSLVGWNQFRLILWYVKSIKTKVTKRYRDVIEFQMVSTKNDGWEYPNPKDVYSYSKLIEMFSNENDLIIDPFLGSGTTLLACQDLGRSCIGIEINPEYCDIVKKRCFGRAFFGREAEYRFQVFGEDKEEVNVVEEAF